MQPVHISRKLLEGDTCIYLRSADICMAQHTADTLDGQSCIQAHHGKAMTGTVERYVSFDAATPDDEWDMFGQSAISDGAKDTIAVGVVAADDFCGLRQ